MKNVMRMKKVIALACAMVLCVCGTLSALAEDGERVYFENANVSMTLPTGWRYSDLTEAFMSTYQERDDASADGSQLNMLGYYMIGDTQLILITVFVGSLTEDMSLESEISSFEKAYPDTGKWIEVDGVQLFTFKDDYNIKYVMGYDTDRYYNIYGEVVNEGYEQQFDAFIESFEFS